MRTASASSSYGMTDQHRPEDLVLGDPHLVVHVGEDGGLDVEALARARAGRPPPVVIRAPSSRPDAMYALDPRALPLGDQRPELGLRRRTGSPTFSRCTAAVSASTTSS